MRFKFKISERLVFLREKYMAEGLNQDELEEYGEMIVQFIVTEVLEKLFKFPKDKASIKKASKIARYSGMKH